MLKDILKLKSPLSGARPGNRPFRKSSQGFRPSIELLEGRRLLSVTAVAPGFNVAAFAPPPSISGVTTSGPDSIAVDQNAHVFVGYNNGTPKDSTDPKVTSTIVEYSAGGAVLHYWTPQGHNDGLKVDPHTGKVWALQNEDGNPNLLVIDPWTISATAYTFAPPDNGGTGTPGGYDDIAFLKGKIYLTESNPDPTSTGSAVVEVQLPSHPSINNQVIIVRSILPTNATATDPSGNKVSLTLSDPDSMTVSGNNLVFTSQADDQILTIHHPGPHQRVTVANVHDAAHPSKPVEVDDTFFTPDAHGAILVVDTGAAGSAGTVYQITGSAVKKGLVLSSGDLSHTLGILDPQTGLFTPVITGFAGQPKGIAFLPAASRGDGSEGDQLDDHGNHNHDE